MSESAWYPNFIRWSGSSILPALWSRLLLRPQRNMDGAEVHIKWPKWQTGSVVVDDDDDNADDDDDDDDYYDDDADDDNDEDDDGYDGDDGDSCSSAPAYQPTVPGLLPTAAADLYAVRTCGGHQCVANFYHLR